MARERFRAIGIDQGPNTAAESCAEAARGEGTQLSRTRGQGHGLLNLVAKKYLCVRLRVRRKLSYAALIALPERVDTFDRPEVFADEMEEAFDQRDLSRFSEPGLFNRPSQ